MLRASGLSMPSEQPHDSPSGKETSGVFWPSLTIRRWLWLAYAVAWTIALLAPVPLKNPPNPLVAEAVFTFSKALHVMAYALFTGLSAWMMLPLPFRWLLIIFLVGHGMLTELLQYLMHDLCGRTGQWSDVVLDCIGITIGVAVTWKWWRAPTAPQSA
jgi:VanZ family protein